MVAVIEGNPTVIINAEGSRTTPSVVAFKEGKGRLVGQVAKRQGALNPEKPYSVKRFMGRRFKEVEDERKLVPYQVVAGPNDAVRFKVDDKLYAPEEISAMVLSKLAEDAANYLGEKVVDAVITVPAYLQRRPAPGHQRCRENSGAECVRIINEPTAAALAYGLDKKDNETILVFDLGTLRRIHTGGRRRVFEVKATSGIPIWEETILTRPLWIGWRRNSKRITASI